jgi:hypothetical protein
MSGRRKILFQHREAVAGENRNEKICSTGTRERYQKDTEAYRYQPKVIHHSDE